MSPERLAEIRGREQAATEGPWRILDPCDGPDVIIVHGPEEGVSEGERWIADVWGDQSERGDEDGVFITHARTDVPDLLDYVAALEERNRHLEERLGRMSWELEKARRRTA